MQLDPQARWLQVCDTAGQVNDAPASAPRHPALGLGSGHRVVEKIAAIHNARFAQVPAPAGFSRCYRVVFDAAPAVT